MVKKCRERFGMETSSAQFTLKHVQAKKKDRALLAHLNLPTPESGLQTRFLDSYPELDSAVTKLEHLAQYGDRKLIVGMDCEWQPDRPGCERHPVSILQLATVSMVYILDMLEFSNVQYADLLQRLFAGVLLSNNCVAVGYHLAGDLRRLKHTFPFIQDSSANIADLGLICTGVRGLSSLAEVMFSTL
jgi:hypothetical protein